MRFIHHLPRAGLVFLPLFAPFPGSKSEAADPVRTVDSGSVVQYIEGCRKPNGAFGPPDQWYTDAAWNFPAVAALLHLGTKIEKPEAVLENGLGFPRGHVGPGHWHFFHRHRIRQLLGKPAETRLVEVRLSHQGYEIRYYGSPFGTGGKTFFEAEGRAGIDPRDSAAAELGYYNLSSLYYLLRGLRDSGRRPANPEELVEFVRSRQAPNGGFVDLRAEGAEPGNEGAHIAHTFQSIALLEMLGARARDPERCLRFVRSCRDESGGYRWHPDATRPGNRPDVYYLRSAVRTLHILGARPRDEAACLDWINSLHNADGGFGDRPGWRSRLYSTFYAIDALAVLTNGDPAAAIERKERKFKRPGKIPPGKFHIYQGLNKVPVIGPGDLEGLAERGFHLLALKSDDFETAGTLRRAIRDRSLEMDVILGPEAYPHRALRHGGALLHHIANPLLDPAWKQDRRAVWKAADEAGRAGLPWADYQRKVIRPVREQLDSLIYPEQDFEMEYAYSAYDAGLEGGLGYNAILAGFNWAPRDFIRVFPWRERYVDKLVPMADADAHGDLEKWSPQLDHTRFLYLAEGPGFADFRDAARDGRVVCAIRNPEPGEPPVTLYGKPAAVACARDRVREWKWWE